MYMSLVCSQQVVVGLSLWVMVTLTSMAGVEGTRGCTCRRCSFGLSGTHHDREMKIQRYYFEYLLFETKNPPEPTPHIRRWLGYLLRDLLLEETEWLPGGEEVGAAHISLPERFISKRMRMW